MSRWRVLGPDVGVLVEPLATHATAWPLISLNPDLTLEMGSVFKVFVLAAFARLVDQGEASWKESFRLTSEVRLPHRAMLETMPDGAAISAGDLLVAMMGPSDNSATVMLMAALPDGALDETIRLAGPGSTSVASDLRPAMR